MADRPVTVSLFGSVAWVLVVIATYNLLHEPEEVRWKWILLLLCLMVPFVAVFLMTGMREHAIKPIAMIVFGYVLVRGRLPWKFILPMLLVFVVLLSPWLSIYKRLAGSIHKDDQTILERIELRTTLRARVA